ncbi:Hypothetical predicted protein [Mytilus galloprovincialis]|uniref:C2H2-type domain-containing protein n=1 Tax=Mytilus galloprovincialis TaxID=29158 RepID=A0A8B6F1L9_MYTGA|nr:Hypothetical predicted protein [Mytilus galloprovincialis]
MLTSSVSSQFIHPDYLQPLPTTLDAKKSPLALLAQTCSSIGKDTATSSKPIIPPLKKETNTEKHSEKVNMDKSKHNEIKEKDIDSSEKPGFRTVSHKDMPPLIPTSKPKEEKPTSPLSLKTLPRSKELTSTASSTLSSHADHHFSRSNVSRSPGQHHSPHNEDEKRQVSSASPRYESRTSREPDEHKPSSYPSYSAYPSISNSFLSYSHASGLTHDSVSGLPGFPLPLPAHSSMFGSSSAAAAALAAQSAAYAAQSSALKSAAMASSLSPFVSYARVRTPSGATTLVPVCRDPYCNHCQLTVQNSHLSATCTAVGCAQCAHEKSLHNLSLGLQGSSFNPYSSSSLLAGQSNLSGYPLSSLYLPGHLTSPAHSGLPLVCNWVSSGNEHCGKRFSSSEELLQHLRTHTTSSDHMSLATAYERYGLPPPGLHSLSGLHGHSLQSGSLSPNSLRRSYPTSLSPLSSLMGSGRYHPYKSLMNPSAALPSNQPLPQVGPYLSPYSLYGQRIGAAAVP